MQERRGGKRCGLNGYEKRMGREQKGKKETGKKGFVTCLLIHCFPSPKRYPKRVPIPPSILVE